MANIVSIDKKHNDIMQRTEGKAIIEFENTLSINDARGLLVKKLSIENDSLLKILKLTTKYRKHIAEVLFEVYDNAELMKKIEVIPRRLKAKPKAEEKKES